jgi:hypothetical protein
MAGEVITAFRVSARRACDLVGCDRSTFYYRARRRDVAPLRMRLRELAAARPRFGYRRLHILLRREGWRINAKKTYRLSSSRASMAACGTSISTPSCSSRWPMPRPSYWSGNGTTMRSGRIAPWGQIPPREFVAAWQLTRTARGEILNLETV